MIPSPSHPVVREVVEKDIKRMAKGGKIRYCTNPKCFDDTCKGECAEINKDDDCPCGGLCN